MYCGYTCNTCLTDFSIINLVLCWPINTRRSMCKNESAAQYGRCFCCYWCCCHRAWCPCRRSWPSFASPWRSSFWNYNKYGEVSQVDRLKSWHQSLRLSQKIKHSSHRQNPQNRTLTPISVSPPTQSHPPSHIHYRIYTTTTHSHLLFKTA